MKNKKEPHNQAGAYIDVRDCLIERLCRRYSLNGEFYLQFLVSLLFSHPQSLDFVVLLVFGSSQWHAPLRLVCLVSDFAIKFLLFRL